MGDTEKRWHLYDGMKIVTVPVTLSIPGYMHLKRIAYEEDNPEGAIGWGETEQEAIEHFALIAKA